MVCAAVKYIPQTAATTSAFSSFMMYHLQHYYVSHSTHGWSTALPPSPYSPHSHLLPQLPPPYSPPLPATPPTTAPPHHPLLPLWELIFIYKSWYWTARIQNAVANSLKGQSHKIFIPGLYPMNKMFLWTNNYPFRGNQRPSKEICGVPHSNPDILR